MREGFVTGKDTLNRKELSENGAETGRRSAAGNYRPAFGVWLSSIGIGTYLGHWDTATDLAYTEAVKRYLRAGGNVIDTAANYRFQRSERSIGKALSQLGEEAVRGEIFVCTKGGYLPFDAVPPDDVNSYFEENFVKTGIAAFDDLVGGSHCMAPGYLRSQIDQSRKNLDLDTLDLYYIHNPESQLESVDRVLFEARIAKAFETLEESRQEGRIKYYGVASWNGFRALPDEKNYHSLERFANIAHQVGGDGNGFKFIQLPLNLAMPEAYLVSNQAVSGRALSTADAAADLGICVMSSAPLLQGRLAQDVPLRFREALGGTTDAMTSLQFARSTPGITTALVGMRQIEHVDEIMALAGIPPSKESVFKELFASSSGL